MTSPKKATPDEISLGDVMAAYEMARDAGKIDRVLMSDQEWIDSLTRMESRLRALEPPNAKAKPKGFSL